jgi:hypothetical protein
VPSSACERSSVPIMVSSSDDDDNEDENPPLHAHLLLDESIEHELAPAPQLFRWVCSTQKVVGDLVGDPSDQHRTCLEFQRASSLLAQVSEICDPETFAEASSHPDWDTVMNEEHHFLMANDTWDLVPFPKGRKPVICKWVYRTN